MNKNILDKLRRIQEIIHIFGDKNYQKNVWIEGLGLKVSSYEENRAQIYDDLDFEEFLAEESDLLHTINLLKPLTSWNEAFNKFDGNISTDENGFISPDILMENKEWIQIQDESRACAAEIDFIISQYNDDRCGKVRQ